jgi:ABC-2 type transport system permease protein
VSRVGTGAIVQLGVKELRSVWHDKVLLLFMVWAFSFGIYSAATAVSRELHHAPIAVVDEDRSALSQRITSAFYRPYFLPPVPIGLGEVDRGLDTGRYTFVLDIPPNFQRDVQAGRRPTVQLNIDATRMSQAFIGATYIQNIVADEVGGFVQRRRADATPSVPLVVRVKFNPNLNGIWFGGVMKIIDNITLLSVILAGAALIREREHGTLEHLLVMPLTPLQIMAAKVWANGLVVLVAATLSLWIVVKGALGVPIAGSLTLFLFGAMLHLFSTTSLGIVLATVARSMPQFGLLMILVMLPLQMLSGAMTPRDSMPEAVQIITLAAPTTHFVRFAQAILYRRTRGRVAGLPGHHRARCHLLPDRAGPFPWGGRPRGVLTGPVRAGRGVVAGH